MHPSQANWMLSSIADWLYGQGMSGFHHLFQWAQHVRAVSVSMPLSFRRLIFPQLRRESGTHLWLGEQRKVFCSPDRRWFCFRGPSTLQMSVLTTAPQYLSNQSCNQTEVLRPYENAQKRCSSPRITSSTVQVEIFVRFYFHKFCEWV